MGVFGIKISTLGNSDASAAQKMHAKINLAKTTIEKNSMWRYFRFMSRRVIARATPAHNPFSLFSYCLSTGSP